METRKATSKEAMAAWVRETLSRTGKSQTGLASALGLHHAQGYRIANGLRPLKLAEVPLVERFLQARVPSELLRAADDTPTPEHGLPSSISDFVPVPVFDLRAAAGAGAVAFADAEPVDWLMFRQSYLHRAASGRANLFVLEITGDSNWPFLHHGDHALVDRGQTNPRREGRYVIRIDDVLQVKLVSMNPTNRRLTIKADNPDYPTYGDIDPDEIAIVGRVIWIGRSLG